MSSWLIFSNKIIQRYFILLFGISLSLGVYRFLFPFQVINIGGDDSLISLASAIFAVGQIISYLILCKIVNTNTYRFLAGGLSIIVVTATMGFLKDPQILSVLRIFDGLGYGFIFLGIIALASNFKNREGEVLGNLFAAVLSGSALGQGIAGVLWEILSNNGLSDVQAIQLIANFMTIFGIVIVVILHFTRIKEDDTDKKSSNAWKWQHFHIKEGIKTLMVPSIFLLVLIYLFYDFAHGIYTPNLSILLNQGGIPAVGVSLGYLVGDITWGISQIFTGRLVDRIGSFIPLIFSLLIKGFVVFFYPEIGLVIFLFLILFLAGLAEGFLEPARNKAVLEIEVKQGYTHSHQHLNLGFSASGSTVMGIHDHDHDHEMEQENLVSILQSLGIISFGFGSFFGSLLLVEGFSLAFVTSIGGVCLIIASVLAILFSVVKKSNKNEKIT